MIFATSTNSFNTQLPEGGCGIADAYDKIIGVSTLSCLKAAVVFKINNAALNVVSTLSCLKAAAAHRGRRRGRHWVSTLSCLKAAARPCGTPPPNTPFQHSAA